jgi:hypothetical protein
VSWKGQAFERLAWMFKRGNLGVRAPRNPLTNLKTRVPKMADIHSTVEQPSQERARVASPFDGLLGVKPPASAAPAVRLPSARSDHEVQPEEPRPTPPGMVPPPVPADRQDQFQVFLVDDGSAGDDAPTVVRAVTWERSLRKAIARCVAFERSGQGEEWARSCIAEVWHQGNYCVYESPAAGVAASMSCQFGRPFWPVAPGSYHYDENASKWYLAKPISARREKLGK